MKMKTRVAVLGALAEFHREAIPYNLATLVALVTRINPDFLGLDMTQEQWRRQAFAELPPEYSEALLPLAHQTDIVVAPLTIEPAPPPPLVSGVRGVLVNLLRRFLAFLQRTAPGPDAINQGPRHFLADAGYFLIDLLAGSGRHQEQNQRARQLARCVCDLAQRDPGSRILAVLNVQHCHHVRNHLKREPALTVVHYRDL